MKKIKDSIAGILYRILVIIVKLLPTRSGTNHLLIIKLDEIGDYMLFRNNLKYFRQSEKYKNHKITLLGNAAWKPIFDEYDNDTVDDTIWITKKKFNSDLDYRFSILKKVRLAGASDVINCVFSRSVTLDDGFAWVATGKHKTAMQEDAVNTNRGKNSRNIDTLIYNSIISAGDEKIFDAIRNNNFYNKVLNLKIPLGAKLQLTGKFKIDKSNYFVIFIGAGNKKERKWPVENFRNCAEYIRNKYGLFPIICGGPTEIDDAAAFMNTYNGYAENYVAKTTLPQFIEIAGGSKFLLSVDTGPVHMAAASGLPVVAMYSGVHYGRYAPYPLEISKQYYSIYPDFIDELVTAKSEKLYDSFTLKNESIRSIPVEKVLPYIDAVLDKYK